MKSASIILWSGNWFVVLLLALLISASRNQAFTLLILVRVSWRFIVMTILPLCIFLLILQTVRVNTDWEDLFPLDAVFL